RYFGWSSYLCCISFNMHRSYHITSKINLEKMAKTKKNTTTKKINKQKTDKPIVTYGTKIMFLIGTIFLMSALALFLSFISYLYTGYYDQNVVNELSNREIETQNWLGKLGAFLADVFVFRGFGVASFLFVKIATVIAIWFGFRFSAARIRKIIFWDLF